MSTIKPKVDKFTDHNIYDNHLQQCFNQQAPNLVWASDITYIKVESKFAYLCAIIDLFSRKVISYTISNKPDCNLAIDAFQDAYKK